MASRYGGITGSKRISEDFQNINIAFENVQADVDARKNETDKVKSDLEAHKTSTSAHKAEDIIYSGQVPGNDVKEVIDNVNGRISEIVAQAGNDNTEIVDARDGFPVLGARLDAIDAEIENRIQKGTIGVNVRDYGAVGDGVADDTAAFNAALADLVNGGGGTFYMPHGNYKINSKILIDITNTKPSEGKGISIRGDNMNTTVVTNAGVDFAFEIINTEMSSEGLNSYFHAENFMIQGAHASAKGIKMMGFSQSALENVVLKGLEKGILAHDMVTMILNGCRFFGNLYGFDAPGQINLSSPNAITFSNCVFYGNGVYAAYIAEGCNVNFFGGTIETTGFRSDITGLRWGVKLSGFGRYGAGGALFSGVYFEGNENVADVWIEHKDYAATYTFVGCSFNKFEDPRNSEHNIRVDTNSNLNLSVAAKLNVYGCGFRAFGNYTPSSAKKVIRVYGDTKVVFEQSGNFYLFQEELPENPSNRIYAHGRIINLSSSPAIYRAFNVSHVTRNGVGDYTINFVFPSVAKDKTTVISTDMLGFSQVVEESITSIRVKTYNTTGAPADPGQLSFQSFE